MAKGKAAAKGKAVKGKAAPASPPVPFAWDDLGRYKAGGRFLDGYPENVRTFYSPVDQVHELLRSLLASTQKSIVLNMFGYDDPELNDLILEKLTDEQVYVQMSLDSREAALKFEQTLLAKWRHELIGNSIAIGHSTKGAISHMKILIVDGIYTVRGSTNWSLSGEEDQDNELTVHNDAVIAAETRAELDRNHDAMLKQMAKKRAEEAAKEAAPGKKGAAKKRAEKTKSQ
ncbi:MAG TPA: phospholipase D-like domain-containing protein [Solirubrobacteraceae bacterium]|jgi:phosphatidylserine/phosphatidylglycerophosphate/cardiolipin synthase-like enzyme|nr:phospholipase D-like domain-containing protein [Solirubrobacteraceae bacterium]